MRAFAGMARSCKSPPNATDNRIAFRRTEGAPGPGSRMGRMNAGQIREQARSYQLACMGSRQDNSPALTSESSKHQPELMSAQSNMNFS